MDLSDVPLTALDRLWQHEQRLWRERLLWDITGLIALLRQGVRRGGIPGKAVRLGAQTAGSAYYVVPDGLGVLAGFSVLPPYQQPEVATVLLRATVEAMRRLGLRRIQSQFLYLHDQPSDPMGLPAVFAQEDFETHWRDFLRVDLGRVQAVAREVLPVRLVPWQASDLPVAAEVMQAAYEGEVDAQMDRMYRTPSGCRAVLENILRQQGIGRLVSEASALARHGNRVVGFTLITEISPRQGHLAQIVVSPTYQRRGIGRALLHYSLSQLKALAFDTLSLMVSRANPLAMRMYQQAGFEAVCPLPVFVWES